MTREERMAAERALPIICPYAAELHEGPGMEASKDDVIEEPKPKKAAA